MGKQQRPPMCSPAPPPNVAIAKGFGDVFEFIEPTQTNCLNQKDEHPWQAMLKGGDDDQFCESILDEQLLLNIGFREKVKIKSFVIKGAAGHEDSAPSDVKVNGRVMQPHARHCGRWDEYDIDPVD